MDESCPLSSKTSVFHYVTFKVLIYQKENTKQNKTVATEHGGNEEYEIGKLKEFH